MIKKNQIFKKYKNGNEQYKLQKKFINSLKRGNLNQYKSRFENSWFGFSQYKSKYTVGIKTYIFLIIASII